MRFWDSSALVPLLSDEEKTDIVRALFQQDRNIVTAFIKPVESLPFVSFDEELLEAAAAEGFPTLP